jgi:ribosomal protein S8
MEILTHAIPIDKGDLSDVAQTISNATNKYLRNLKLINSNTKILDVNILAHTGYTQNVGLDPTGRDDFVEKHEGFILVVKIQD